MKERRRYTDRWMIEFTPKHWTWGIMFDPGLELHIAVGPFGATWWFV